jgi:folate-binding protein YgfZ
MTDDALGAANFGDARREYLALTESVGLVEMPWLGRLKVTGSDRVDFLQGMLSNDVKSLMPGTGCPALLLTEQGKIVADLIVLAEADSFMLDGSTAGTDAAHATLERFLVADDVTLTSANQVERRLALIGPAALTVAECLGVPVPTAAYAHRTALVGGITIQTVRIPGPGVGGLLCHVAVDCATDFARRCSANGIIRVGAHAYDVLRIESGIPWHGRDVTADTLALEAPYDAAISFRKGCYLGQEVMERVTARGHVNRRLVGLTIDGDAPPPPGVRLHADGRDVGWVTSAAWSWRVGAVVALGYVRREYLEPGSVLAVGSAAGVRATVRALPL